MNYEPAYNQYWVAENGHGQYHAWELFGSYIFKAWNSVIFCKKILTNKKNHRQGTHSVVWPKITKFCFMSKTFDSGPIWKLVGYFFWLNHFKKLSLCSWGITKKSLRIWNIRVSATSINSIYWFIDAIYSTMDSFIHAYVFWY